MIKERQFHCAIISARTRSQLRQKWVGPPFSNGELLDAAEKEFDLLITTDQALRTQQNLPGRKLAVLILPFASWPRLKLNAEKIVSRVAALRAGEYAELHLNSLDTRADESEI